MSVLEHIWENILKILPWWKGIAGYLLAVNLLGCILTVCDKKRAKRGAWRIPEKTLLGVAALGGAIGTYLTMKGIRHKTKHAKFMLGIPLIFLAELALCLFFLWIL